MTIRTIIVDDEELGRKRISTLLKSEADIELVAECGDAASANQAIAREKPDLLLLDIQMPGQDGFSVIEAMEEEQRPVVVFVTAYDQYALRAFEAAARRLSFTAASHELHVSQAAISRRSSPNPCNGR